MYHKSVLETHLASSISAHFIVASSDATQAFRNSESAWFSVQLRCITNLSFAKHPSLASSTSTISALFISS